MKSVLTGFLPLGLLTAMTVMLPESLIAQDTAAEKFTVMTWNVEWFFDDDPGDNYSKLAKEKTAPSRADWDWHRDAVARSINIAKPTVLALQEVENRRVLYYLSRALEREFKLKYEEVCDQSGDHFTEQDVGLMYRAPADLLSRSHMAMTRDQRKTQNYFDLSKHIIGVFSVPTGTGVPERVTVMNLHWRSRAEGESIRIRQARLVHHWMRETIASGENVIVLGDTNTEENGDTTRAESELGIVCGSETKTTDDDLFDLHLKLPPEERGTHLLPGREFDRILVSQSLLDDDPNRPDLVFSSIKVRRDLSIQGEQDSETEHWEEFWQREPNERDLSDHYPVLATFEIK